MLRQLILKSLGIAVFASALFGASGDALAQVQIDNANGVACKAYFPADETFLQKSVSGIRNSASVNKWVICPMDRTASKNNGAWLGFSPSASTACYGQSRTFSNALLASGNLTGGPGLRWINLTGAGKSQAYSNFVMYCSLPAGAFLHHVVTYEN